MAINLQQTSVFNDADNNGRQDAGEQFQFTFTLNNDGATVISGISLVDDLVSVDLSGFDDTLDPGETVELTGTYVLTQENVDQGEVRNTTTVTGGSGTVLATQENVVPLTRISVLAVSKNVDGFELGPDGEFDAGDQVIYSYIVNNDGNATLFNVTLTDDDGVSTDANVPLVGLTDQDGDGEADDLAVGQSATGTLASTFSQGDLDAGLLFSTAIARAQNLSGFPPVIGSGTAVVELERLPSIALDKTASIVDGGSLVDSLDDQIEYSYAVTNTGNISLLNVQLNDDNGTPNDTSDDFENIPLTGLTDIDGDGDADDLAVGAIATGSVSIGVTQGILDAGQITNIAEVEAFGTNSQRVTDDDDATVLAEITPEIEVTKTIEPGTVVDQAGDSVVYNYTVENTGNVSLLDVTLVDDNGTPGDTSDDVLVTPLVGLTDLDGDGDADDLAVGATATGSYTGTVSQAAVDARELTNIVVGTGTSPNGEEVEDDDMATIGIEPSPAIDVTKEIEPGTVVTQAGDTIVYNYTLENTGNVSLLNVTLIDDNGTPTDLSDDVSVSPLTGLSDLDGDGDADDLAVGATATGTYTGILTQEAADAGVLTNIVVGTGTSPNGEEVQDDDSATISVDPMPAIEVIKTAEVQDTNANGVADIGEDVLYTYTLTNTGNVSLNNATLVDDNGTPGDTSDDVTITALASSSPNGTVLVDSPNLGLAVDLIDADGDGEIDDLAVGGTATATYTTTITEEIAAAGSLTNIVIGSGTSPDGQTVEDQDEATVVTLIPDPGIELTKFTSATAFSDPALLEAPESFEEALEIAAGDAVYWIYSVENTGNIAFQQDQIAIVDDNGTPDDASDDALIVPTLIASTDSNGNGLLDVGETWYYQAEGIAQDLSFEFDFDSEQAFSAGDDADILNAFYETQGLSISTPLVGGDATIGNRAMIFDTANPTGQDFDLGTPHGNPGRGRGAGAGIGNDTPLGNVLIISEDGDSSDPDDNASGGVLQFDWLDGSVRLTQVGLLDIDRSEDVTVATSLGGDGVSTYAVQDLGDNSHQQIDLEGTWADQLTVSLEHSGAVSSVSGIGLYQNTATVTAIASGTTLTDTSISFYTNSIL